MLKLYGVNVWALEILSFIVLPIIRVGNLFLALKGLFLIPNVQCLNLFLFHLEHRIHSVMRKL